MRQEKSRQYFEKARGILVGGVNSPVRSFKGVGGNPLVMRKGERSQLYDYDGNVFTDYCLSWGALILGHAHRNVVLATKKTAERGISFGVTTRDEIDLAEHIVGCVPSIEQIRFVNSGTEATMSALRLARGYTARDLVVKFDGCYHGHSDDLLATAGSGVAHLPASSSKGVPAAHVANTISLPFNDVDAVTAVFEQQGDRIAAVIVEPVAGNMGVIPGTKDFLQILRDVTQQHGVVLIFDEIMCGFRTARGCVQSEYGIIPDMTCLGKIIGGGFPVGAYGGKREIMQTLAPQGDVYQAGTFAGTPVVMKAGLAALRLLDDRFYAKLNERSQRTAEAINAVLKEAGADAHLSHYGSMMSLRFRKEPVANYRDAQAACGGERYAKLFWFLLERGIYWPPADLEALFISVMHTNKELEELVGAVKDFFTAAE